MRDFCFVFIDVVIIKTEKNLCQWKTCSLVPFEDK